jgi:hypothetical protein
LPPDGQVLVRYVFSMVEPEAYQRALHAELDRRITELGATSDEACGRIGPGDAILVAVLFVLVPVLVIWAAR